MKRGFVFGKFLPMHKGHVALINFASQHCDHLYIVVCFTAGEAIDPVTRKQWLHQAVGERSNIDIISFGYDEKEIPNTSVSSREVSEVWAKAFKKILPAIDFVFTSEPYGDYVAEYMGIRHVVFNEQRDIVPVSATQIRNDPFKYWELIPEHVRYWFVKKVALLGTESTGKSVLAEKLAQHFTTAFVPEMAREIIEHTTECTYNDLEIIAMHHAKTIQKIICSANKLLFLDTDINITMSYSKFLFNRELVVEPWIEEVNKADLYLFLEPDCTFVQDGTRLSEIEREELNLAHKEFLTQNAIDYISIGGNWDDRFKTAVNIIKKKYFV